VDATRDELKIAEHQKRSYILDLFARVAPRYDLLNSLLSLGVHYYWREKAARVARLQPGDTALDVCTGTADLAIRLARDVGEDGKVVGADFCEPMLRLGQRKVRKQANGQRVSLVLADALQLPFALSLIHI